MKNSRISRYIKLFSFFFSIFFILRVIFFFKFKEPNILIDQISKALYLGIKFDLRLCVLLMIPIVLVSWLKPFDFLRNKKAGKGWGIFYSLVFGAVLFIYAVDFNYYSYLKNRLNATSLILLQDMHTAWGMVWQTYPVVWGSIFFIILLSLIYLVISQYLLNQREEIYFPSRQSQIIAGSLYFLVNAWFVYGSFTHYPLRWSEAIFSKNEFINSLGLNPVLYFADSFAFRNETYNRENFEKYFKDMANYYRVENKDLSRVSNVPSNETRPNVVLIVMESMAYHKSSLMNNPLDPTPYLKSLANESVLFDRFFVPVESTARSMFAIMTGIPDVSLAKSASRNPMIVKRHLIMDDFKGYEKFYFLGGSANWGQIRSVFTNNIEGIKIFEEGSYTTPAMDVWGISDLDLVKEAHQVFQKTEKPFIAVIQFASFHRPYTIPQRRDDFKTVEVSQNELSHGSFNSIEQLNSLRFSDYALGAYISLAKKSPYYKNTIFVVTGDHGLPHEGDDYTPKSYRDLGLGNFHVPLIIHAPGIFKIPELNSTLSSEVDIMPTVATLAGISFKNEGMGINILDKSVKERFAFNYYWYNTNYNLIGDKHLLKINKDSGESELFDLGSGERVSDQVTQEKMTRLAHGFYETSRFFLFKNMNLSNR